MFDEEKYKKEFDRQMVKYGIPYNYKDLPKGCNTCYYFDRLVNDRDKGVCLMNKSDLVHNGGFMCTRWKTVRKRVELIEYSAKRFATDEK